MQTIDYTMQVPKELMEVIDLLDLVVEKVKAGAEISDYTALLPQLMQAVDGVDKISDEVKGQFRDEAAGYMVHKLMGRLLPAE